MSLILEQYFLSCRIFADRLVEDLGRRVLTLLMVLWCDSRVDFAIERGWRYCDEMTHPVHGTRLRFLTNQLFDACALERNDENMLVAGIHSDELCYLRAFEYEQDVSIVVPRVLFCDSFCEEAREQERLESKRAVGLCVYFVVLLIGVLVQFLGIDDCCMPVLLLPGVLYFCAGFTTSKERRSPTRVLLFGLVLLVSVVCSGMVSMLMTMRWPSLHPHPNRPAPLGSTDWFLDLFAFLLLVGSHSFGLVAVLYAQLVTIYLYVWDILGDYEPEDLALGRLRSHWQTIRRSWVTK